MHFEHVNDYDASTAEVFAMLTDPAFREKVCARIRAVDYSASVTPQGSGAVVVVDQRQPVTGRVPGFAQKFVGDAVHIVQRETWHDASSADFEVEIPGKPGHCRGTMTLQPQGGGTRQVITGEVKVSVPLVGGKLEALIGESLASSIRYENLTGKDWLAGRR